MEASFDDTLDGKWLDSFKTVVCAFLCVVSLFLAWRHHRRLVGVVHSSSSKKRHRRWLALFSREIKDWPLLYERPFLPISNLFMLDTLGGKHYCLLVL